MVDLIVDQLVEFLPRLRRVRLLGDTAAQNRLGLRYERCYNLCGAVCFFWRDCGAYRCTVRASMKDQEPLLTVNLVALRVVLILLLATVVFLLWVYLSNSALLLGLMLAGFFLALVVIAILGAIAYVILFIANVRATFRKNAGAPTNQAGHIWLVFVGITVFALLLSVIGWLFLAVLWSTLGTGSSTLWLV
jgi:hypothetical protein